MKATERILGSGWKDAVRDMVIVVVSILIAFALDAWWDERTERREERDALAGLAVEVDSIAGRLSESVVVHEGMLEDTERVLRRLGPAATPWSDWESEIAMLFTAFTVDPPTGHLDALIASGRIRLITDPTLGAAIAALPRRITDASEEELVIIRHLEDHLIPYVRTHVALADLLPTQARDGSLHPADPTALLRSRAFENLLVERAAGIAEVVREQSELVDDMLTLADRIEVAAAEIR